MRTYKTQAVRVISHILKIRETQRILLRSEGWVLGLLLRGAFLRIQAQGRERETYYHGSAFGGVKRVLIRAIMTAQLPVIVFGLRVGEVFVTRGRADSGDGVRVKLTQTHVGVA